MAQIEHLKAFADASGTGQNDVFVLAGYVSTTERWTELSERWQAILEIDSPSLGPPMTSFKIRTMAREGRWERTGLFYAELQKCVMAEVSVIINVPDLINVVRTTHWPKHLGDMGVMENPYYFGFKAIIRGLAQIQTMLGLDQPVDFVFDEQTEKHRVLTAWDVLKRTSAHEVQKYIGNTPEFKSDDEVLPLQGADLIAWWIRRWTLEKKTDWKENREFPWPKQQGSRVIPGISLDFNEQQLRANFAAGGVQEKSRIVIHETFPDELLKRFS